MAFAQSNNASFSMDISNENMVSKYYMYNSWVEYQYVPEGWDSIFIPTLPTELVNDQSLTYIFEMVLKIGKVKRVDIVKKAENKYQHMAFIHFSSWNKSAGTDNFRYCLENSGFVDIFGAFTPTSTITIGTIIHGRPNSPERYIRVLINKTPIKETTLNIHQLAANMEIMETTVKTQQEMIEKLVSEIEFLKEKLNTNKNTSTPNAPEKEYRTIDIDIESLDEVKMSLYNNFSESSYN